MEELVMESACRCPVENMRIHTRIRGAGCFGVCDLMEGLCRFGLEVCDIFRRWHCKDPVMMRTGATALKGSAGAAKLMMTVMQA